jgi:hypothetical protein
MDEGRDREREPGDDPAGAGHPGNGGPNDCREPVCGRPKGRELCVR